MTLSLISIGIVAEDGREYSAISNEFNPKYANDFVWKNVFPHIIKDFVAKNGMMKLREFDPIDNIRDIQYQIGKSGKEIAKEVFEFLNPALKSETEAIKEQIKFGVGLTRYFEDHNCKIVKNIFYAQPEFYAYYSHWDWVLFSGLFGSFETLPPGIPFYCMDLKQMMQERGLTEEWKDLICPLPEGEHSAIIDARWAKNLYDEIIKHSLYKQYQSQNT